MDLRLERVHYVGGTRSEEGSRRMGLIGWLSVGEYLRINDGLNRDNYRIDKNVIHSSIHSFIHGEKLTY